MAAPLREATVRATGMPDRLLQITSKATPQHLQLPRLYGRHGSGHESPDRLRTAAPPWMRNPIHCTGVAHQGKQPWSTGGSDKITTPTEPFALDVLDRRGRNKT